jgi:glycosyltransferase involved in cell wall biosynthesis
MNTNTQQKNNLLVSVVVPLYNKSRYIARTIDSILAQSHQNFEIIVVNDGSTDNSPNIVKNYQDTRLRLINQSNSGPGAARNRGLKESSAPLIAFLDADDEWLPDFLQKSVERLQRYPECGLSISGQFRGAKKEDLEPQLRQVGINPGVWKMPTKMKPHLLKPTLDFFHSGAIVGFREVIQQFGGFYQKNRCTYGEDIYLWLQIALNYKVYRDPQALMWYHSEASELGIFQRKVIPAWPMLTDPEPLRNNCPKEYQDMLEKYLAYYTNIAALRYAKIGDASTARRLLKDFPKAKNFRQKYLRVQLEILSGTFPQLREKIRQIKKIFR